MKNKKNRVNIIGKLLYLVVAVLVLMIIPSAAENAYDYFREKQSRKGYTSEKLYEDFCDGDYGRLSEKVAYNRAVEEQSQKMTGTTMLSVPATTAQLIIICTGQPEKQTKLPIHLRYFIRMNQN